MTKTYQTVGRNGGKARIDTVKTLLREYPEAIQGIWLTALHPYRFEIGLHDREQKHIDECSEENGIGAPIEDPKHLLDKIAGYGDVSALVVSEPTDTQQLSVHTSSRTYRIDIDATVIRWVA